MRYAFYLGAAAFFGAVLWTVLTTSEYPPPDSEAFWRAKETHAGFLATLREILTALKEMPSTIK